MVQDQNIVLRLNFAIAISILALALLLAAWILAAGFTLDLSTTVGPAIGFVGMAGAAFFYSHVRPDERIGAATLAMTQLIALTAVCAPLSYVAASLHRPFIDAALYKADKWLGLDWMAYFHFVTARPWLLEPMRVTYNGFMVSIAATVLVLAATRRRRQLAIFVCAFAATTVVTIGVSAVLPGLSAYNYLGLTPADHPGGSVVVGNEHVATLTRLNNGTLRTLVFTGTQGIITFPSLHAALGLLMILATWPVRGVRWRVLGTVNAEAGGPLGALAAGSLRWACGRSGAVVGRRGDAVPARRLHVHSAVIGRRGPRPGA